MVDPTYKLFPDSPKKKGDTWDRQTTLNLGPIGSYVVTYKFKYLEPDAAPGQERLRQDRSGNHRQVHGSDGLDRPAVVPREAGQQTRGATRSEAKAGFYTTRRNNRLPKP